MVVDSCSGDGEAPRGVHTARGRSHTLDGRVDATTTAGAGDEPRAEQGRRSAERLADLEARAARVRSRLVAFWGDDLPPGPDPLGTLLVDALGLDDDAGRARGLVVQGDRVSWSAQADAIGERLSHPA